MKRRVTNFSFVLLLLCAITLQETHEQFDKSILNTKRRNVKTIGVVVKVSNPEKVKQSRAKKRDKLPKVNERQVSGFNVLLLLLLSLLLFLFFFIILWY